MPDDARSDQDRRGEVGSNVVFSGSATASVFFLVHEFIQVLWLLKVAVFNKSGNFVYSVIV